MNHLKKSDVNPEESQMKVTEKAGMSGKSGLDSVSTFVECGEAMCALCPELAVKSCLTCVASYCESHVRQHYTAPALQRHKLVMAIADLEGRICQQHNTELEFFCKLDEKLICPLCVITEHKGHEIISAPTDPDSKQVKTQTWPIKEDLPSPGPITVTSVTADSVSLSWGPPEKISGPSTFRVTWRCDKYGCCQEVQGLTVTVNGLISGKDYTFTVATLDDDGFQSPCMLASTCTDISVPENVCLQRRNESFLLTWGKPGKLTKVSYQLNLCIDGDCVQTISTESLQYNFTDLLIATKYTVAVYTVLNTGRKSKAVERSFETDVPEPSDLKLDKATSTSIQISWNFPDEFMDLPHSFSVSYECQGSKPQSISVSSCSAVITGLKPSTSYYVSLCTESKNGLMSVRRGQSMKTVGLTPPGPIQFSSVTPYSVSLSWGAPEGLTLPHSFMVVCQCYYEHNKAEPCHRVRVRSLEATFHGLIPNKKYDFIVYTVSEEDEKVTSSTVKATTMTAFPAPEKVEVNLTSMSLTWSRPRVIDDVSYQLSLWTGGQCVKTAVTDMEEFSLSDLHFETEYIIKISTLLSFGKTSEPVEKAVRLGLAAPLDLKVDPVTPTSVHVSWTLPQGFQKIPHNFLVSFHRDGIAPQTVSTDSYGTDITGLKPDTKYSISVFTVLPGKKSQASTITTTTALPQPGSIKLISVKSHSLLLSWGSPEGLSGPHRFRVTWKGSGSKDQYCLEPTGQKVDIQGLTPGEKYEFTVATLGRDDSMSPCVSASTYTEVPPPHNLSVEALAESVCIQWHNGSTGLENPSYLLTLSDGKSEDILILTKSSSYTLTELQAHEWTVSVATVLPNGRMSEAVSKVVDRKGFKN